MPTMQRLTRNGSQLEVGGKRWRTTGFNVFQIVNNDYPSPHIPTQAEQTAMLEKAVAAGGYLVRAHTIGVNVGTQNNATLVTGISGTAQAPVIQYRQEAWDAADWAIAEAERLGVYLLIPLCDELHWYHGGKAQWVNFVLPGTCSVDPNVKTANNSAQRAAEAKFYTDPGVRAYFGQYVKDLLNHVNKYTGRANKDSPAVAIIESGNEMWTQPQDGKGWLAWFSALVKSVAPQVLVADGAAAAGSWIANQEGPSDPNVDVLQMHAYPYWDGSKNVECTPTEVTREAKAAAAAGKPFIMGEYAWSQANAAQLEQAAFAESNTAAMMPWSLQLDADLHNNGAAYGGEDVSLYYPGKDQTQKDAIARLKALSTSFDTPSAFAAVTNPTPPTGGTVATDDAAVSLGTLKKVVAGLSANITTVDSRAKTAINVANTKSSGAAPINPFPDRAIGVYYMMWAGSEPPIRDIPNAFNVIYLSFLAGDPPVLGGWGGQPEAEFFAELAAFRARGGCVFLSVGGAGYTVDTADHQGFVQAVLDVAAKTPLDGIDWDIEAQKINVDDALAICLMLREHFGPDFGVTLAPNGLNVADYLPLGVALAARGMLSMWGQQFYDAGVNSPIPENLVRQRIGEASAAGIPPYLQGIGMAVGGVDHDIAGWAQVASSVMDFWPNLRGAYIWHLDTPGTAEWATQIAPIVKG